ncbi:hypothetical protein YTPLAS73_00800 [Nitrosarchaeum sp.]|nr:hypothetical protein YTPLAS73_00800 [Nitrosarchaeum sp.]
MLTKRDILIALVLSFGSLGISIGLVGTKDLLTSFLFFLFPLLIIILLFSIFKQKSENASYKT